MKIIDWTQTRIVSKGLTKFFLLIPIPPHPHIPSLINVDIDNSIVLVCSLHLSGQNNDMLNETGQERSN